MKSKCTIDSNGTKNWELNGDLHREGGPAVEWASGTKFWYQNGKLHREDGPAVESANGNKFWYTHDKRHRIDGPAVEYADGYKAWYINGKELTFKQWLSAVWDTLSKEDQKYYAFNGFEYEE